MDPLSITASVVNILDAVTKLSSAISRFKEDYKLADEDLDVARNHALLLKAEIRGLELQKPPGYSVQDGKDNGNSNPDRAAETGHLTTDGRAFKQAMSAARGLLSDIEASFPLRSEPHTWRSKVRWAIKDKRVFSQLKERLHSAESTLQGIVATEQLRVSRMIYRILVQQQPTMEKLEKGELMGMSVINMAVLGQANAQPPPAVADAGLEEVKPAVKQATQTITKPNKLLPRTYRFERGRISAHLVALPKESGTSYRATVHVSLLGKMYSVQLRMSSLQFSFDRMLHVHNIVPTDSDMAVACRTGDFDRVRRLLESGSAHGGDITASGWPMLDYAIMSGSTRLVRLLLEHGAEPDLAYGEHNMTALQSSFLRGKLDIARVLLSRGADIEHVDSDGYSVLSYLWVVDGQLDKSLDFMHLCLADGFSEVNACDERGWTAFHRAAAVGTRADVEAFLRLGASTDLRAEWYGWTALFFAASHDNVETFLALVRHSGPEAYESLDGDGWNLLHCCVYFGAPRVMRLVLRHGVDVNQKTLPAPLSEDPELAYRELTASDIAFYIGPNRYSMFVDALADTRRDGDLDGCDDIFWDAADSKAGPCRADAGADTAAPIYGAEDIDDRWTVLHWASYNGSPKWRQEMISFAGLPAPWAQPVVMFFVYGQWGRHVTGLVRGLDRASDEYRRALDGCLRPYYARLPGYDAASPACRPVRLLATDWQGDRLAGHGSFTNLPAGAGDAARHFEALRAGDGERRGVWLAGEHTSPPGGLGTVAGAYWAGEEVARRIARRHGVAMAI